jgi:hypothetical protein
MTSARLTNQLVSNLKIKPTLIGVNQIPGHQDYDDRIHRLLPAAFTGFNADSPRGCLRFARASAE